MKTRSIARGIVGSVAALLGVMAAGCSADVAPGDSAEIGSTSEALSNASAVKDLKDAVDLNGNDITDPVGRELAASCVIVDGSTSKMLSIGGFRSSGSPTASDEVFAYDPGANTWTKVATLANARGLAKAIQVPGDTHSCIVVGGLTDKASGSDVSTVEKITISSGTWSVANAGSFTGHDFALARCGSNEIVAIGGRNAAGTLLSGIKRYNATTGTTAWPDLQNSNASPATVSLLNPRASFAFAVQDSNNTQYLLAGGEVSLTHASDTLEALVVQDKPSSSTCQLASSSATTSTNLSGAPNNRKLNTGRFGAVAFPISSTQVMIVGGDNGSAVQTTTETATLNWATPALSAALSQSAANAITGVRYPALVKIAAFQWMMVGGEGYNATNHAGTAIANTAAIQEYSSGLLTPTDLVTGRTGNIAEYIGSTVYTSEGRSPAGVFLTTSESIAP